MTTQDRTKILSIALLVIGLGLAAATRMLPCRSPRALLATMEDALKDGDVASLLATQCLGLVDRTRAEIAQEGEQAFGVRLRIYETLRSLGQAELQARLDQLSEIESLALAAGERRWRELPTAQKWEVWVAASRTDWVHQRALEALEPSERVHVPDAEFFGDRGRREAYELQRGCELEGSDAQAILESVTSGAIDPTDRVARRVLLDCASRGARELRGIERDYDRAVRRVDSGDERPSPEYAPSAAANERAHRISLGEASLNANQRAHRDNVAPWRAYDAQQRAALADSLGLPLLPPPDRAALGGVTRERFLDERPQFVAQQGATRLGERLREEYSDCELEVRRTTFRTPSAASYIGTSHALMQAALLDADADNVFYVDGMRQRVEPSDPVPGEYLVIDVPEQLLTWRQARQRMLLRDGIQPGQRECPSSLPSVARFHRGQWSAAPGIASQGFERNPLPEVQP